MYKRKDRQNKPLFPELLPLNSHLDKSNRWLRIAWQIPWDELESEYASHFSAGRPGADGRLFIGLMLLKHMTGVSYPEIVAMNLKAELAKMG